MARPQRNTVDYFPHYISDGKKMFFFEQKYGNDGYAMWFKLLEKLASTDHHYINLSDETELMFLAAKCRVAEETLTEFLDSMSKFGEIDSELWCKYSVVWSQKFIDSIQDAYSKRSNNCMSYEGLRSHLSCLGVLKGPIKPQSKVKERKEEKSKVKESVFTPPSLENVQMYFFEKTSGNSELSYFEAEKFVDHYTNKDWKIGSSKTKMKDWQAAVRNWLKNVNQFKNNSNGKNERLSEGQRAIIVNNRNL